MSTSPFSSGPSRKSRFRPHRPGEQRLPLSEPSLPEDAEAAPELAEAEFASAAGETDSAQDAGAESEIARRPLRPPGRERYVYTSPYARWWHLPALGLTLLVAGGVGGYFLRGSAVSEGAAAPAKKRPMPTPPVEVFAPPAPLTAEETSELDAAYRAGKEGRFDDAQKLFKAFSAKHPQWSQTSLETARFEIYAQDYPAAQQILEDLIRRSPESRADAYFLSAFMNLRTKSYPEAESAFSAATASDPTRSEYYYLWGECLQQEGKPQEAEFRFRSALWRNQYETADDLIRLKVFLTSISGDRNGSDGTDALLDDALAKPAPPASVLLAAGARLLKAGRVPEAVKFIERGRAVMDQVVFLVAMQDPSFAQEGWRPEMAPFYAQYVPAPAVDQPVVAPPTPSPAAKQL